MTNIPDPDSADIVAYVGRHVIEAAERTGQVKTETAAYDAVAHLLVGAHSATVLLTMYPELEPIREEFSKFAEGLQAILNQPAQEPSS